MVHAYSTEIWVPVYFQEMDNSAWILHGHFNPVCKIIRSFGELNWFFWIISTNNKTG